MDSYAKNKGSNEFFTRRALYNACIKIRRGKYLEARKFLDLALLCIRTGGVTVETENRVLSMLRDLKAAA